MQLSKTNFLQYLECEKSLWLLKHKPEFYPHPSNASYEKKLSQDGYRVQKLVEEFLNQSEESDKYSFNKAYEVKKKLYAEIDIIRQNDDGTLNIYEVKSSSSYKNHIIDIAFQTIVAERSGKIVNSIYIIHLNKEYTRQDMLNINEMMVFTDVTEEVREVLDQLEIKINSALKLLENVKIDETCCSCLELTKSNHCESFDYFNQDIPKKSIYSLPRISKKKILCFSSEGRFNLDDIDESEVTENQLSVLRAAKNNSPLINIELIKNFYEQVKYPLYFLDYETSSSAIPFLKGLKPHAHVPFQFSLHVIPKEDSNQLEHFEYITEQNELPIKLIEKLEEYIGSTGSLVAWHKSFENSRNKEMGILYPQKDGFLTDISDRMIDLEDIFKGGYVDINFNGSTSIKNILPILVPGLSYDNLEVSSGTDAMVAFSRLLEMPEGTERRKLRKDMLDYCERDTLAMVEIFRKIKNLI